LLHHDLPLAPRSRSALRSCEADLFFFSSRRRHTSSNRDWSSDVCSSDLMNEYLPLRDVVFNTLRRAILKGELKPGERLMEIALRSEERRGGTECGSRGGPSAEKKEAGRGRPGVLGGRAQSRATAAAVGSD